MPIASPPASRPPSPLPDSDPLDEGLRKVHLAIETFQAGRFGPLREAVSQTLAAVSHWPDAHIFGVVELCAQLVRLPAKALERALDPKLLTDMQLHMSSISQELLAKSDDHDLSPDERSLLEDIALIQLTFQRDLGADTPKFVHAFPKLNLRDIDDLFLSGARRLEPPKPEVANLARILKAGKSQATAPSAPSRLSGQPPALPSGVAEETVYMRRGQFSAFGKPVLTHVALPTGVYMAADSFARGASGKVRMARRISTGETAPPVAIKELRTQAKATHAQSGLARTRAVSLAVIEEEVATHRRIRAGLEAHSASSLAMAQQLGLGHMCTGSEPSVVIDYGFEQSTGKAFLVTTLAVCSTENLLALGHADPQILRATKAALAASFATQTLYELHRLHRELNLIHLDIKLDNVNVNRFGQFKLSDFGYVRPVDSDGTAGVGFVGGTIATPEMFRHLGANLGPQEHVSTKTDVFALAAATLELVAGEGAHFPFNFIDSVSSGFRSVDIEATRVRLAATTAYAAGLVAMNLSLSALTAQALDQDSLPKVGNAEVEAFFLTCLRAAPGLTMALLPALQDDAARRPTAEDLAASTSLHFPRAGTPAFAAYHVYLTDIIAADNDTELLAAMDDYERLVSSSLPA